eukprot:TRINITY_DN1919_c0_g1_i1.p1 TRINITY_DN1919_c0_g1~~TRINITY_DN1919_c0_g1_i1.p1  ORF type:complete len:119 (+),score=32.40 TRINITY_DN1919_c0_g1_i1:119-475(+)
MEKNLSKTIPIPVARNDGWLPNPRDLSTTPGGTLFAFTPGGTRIVYDREALLMLSHSPLSRTPPTNLPKIPGVTAPEASAYAEDEAIPRSSKIIDKKKDPVRKNPVDDEEDLFHFDGV